MFIFSISYFPINKKNVVPRESGDPRADEVVRQVSELTNDLLSSVLVRA